MSLPPCPQRRRHDGAHCTKTLSHGGAHRYPADNRYDDAAAEAAERASSTQEVKS